MQNKVVNQFCKFLVNFFTKNKNIILGFLFALVLLFVAWGVWFELSHSREETFTFKNARTIPVAQVVAGLPIKMVTLVDANEIKNGKHLVKIPKNATDIKIKKITPAEIRNIEKNKGAEITIDQKLNVLKVVKPVAKKDYAKNFLGSLAYGMNLFLADEQQAVEGAVSAILPDNSSQFVDVSGTAEVLTTPEVTPTPEATSGSEATLAETPAELPAQPADPVIQPDTESADPASPSPDVQDQPLIDKQPCQGDETDNCIAVEYVAPAPVIEKTNTDTGQQVTISAKDETTPLTDVLAFTTIPEIYKVGDENKIKIKWKNSNGQEVPFTAKDLDGNGMIDYLEWTVPHLSEQVFDIIFISKAFQLDADKNITADIYDTVATQDGVYATVPQDNYVRVTFDQILSTGNDITVFARPTDSGMEGSIDVYPVYTDADGNQTEGNKLVPVNDGMNPDFSNITSDPPSPSGFGEAKKYRILLQNLQKPTDLFDLKVVNASVDFDYIVDPSPFISTWDTTLTSTGSSTASQIKLPLYNGGTYNFVVDWGDTSTSTITAWNQAAVTHTYATSGTYTLSITGTLTGWQFNNTGDVLKIKTISQWGILRLGNVGSYFYGTTNLRITAVDALDTTGITNMGSAFRASGIITAPSMGSWNMASVTSLNRMFYSAAAFNENIGGWNTGSVTDTANMFFGANAFNNGGSNTINNWDVSKVGTMGYMFYQDTAFNQPIGNWSTISATDMTAMFAYDTNFNQSIGSWNTAKVTGMASMFFGTAFNQNIGGWSTEAVTTMNSMFRNASAFNNGGSNTINNWDTSKVTDMKWMFTSTVFNQPIGSWSTGNVGDMSYMFQSDAVFNQNIGGWNVSKVTTMLSMFDSDTAFNQNIGAWTPTSLINMGSMFFTATAFNNGGSNTINNWDVSKVTSFAGTFRASGFNQPIGNWNTISAKSINTMFFNAPFNQPIGSWNMSSVTDMRYAFGYDGAFNQNISGWSTANVTDMSYMFTGTAFNQNISGWNTGSVTTMSNMFNGATVFNQNLATWNVTGVTAAGGMASMFTSSGLSSINYSNILVGWSGQVVKSGITFSGGGAKYYTGAPATARGVLTGTYGWTITDGGSTSPISFNDAVNGNWNLGATWGKAGNVEGVGYPGSYDTVVIDSNTVTLAGNQSAVSTTLSSTGVLNLAGNNLTSPTFVSTAKLQLQGGETVSTPTLSAGSTVEYTATSGTRDIKNWTYTNAILKINGNGGTFTLPTNITVAGVNITAGTLDAKSGSNYGITNTGNWANTGTFTPQLGAVVFSGATTTISGTTTFYNFTAITPSQIIIFPQATTTTISGTFQLEGSNGHNILLKSDQAGTDGAKAGRARLDIAVVSDNHGHAYVQYATVYDNNASNGAAQPIQQQNSTDGGNNLGWQFNTLPYISGSVLTYDATTLSSTDITLMEGTTKNVVCSATAYDANGYADLTGVTAVLYRSGIGVGASDDRANHYTLTSQCVASGGSGNTQIYTCTFPVYYYADATDSGTYSSENWLCKITPSDHIGGGTGTTSSGIEMDTLKSIDVGATISYGSLTPNHNTTGNHTVTVTNTGNIATGFKVAGNNLGCSVRSSIPVGNQQYNLSSFSYGAGTALSVTATDVGANLNKPTQSTPTVTQNVYWQVAVPTGTKGTCTGSTSFIIN